MKGVNMCDAQQLRGEQTPTEEQPKEKTINELLGTDPDDLTEEEVSRLAKHALENGWHVSQGGRHD
jgi:hypothetical protein